MPETRTDEAESLELAISTMEQEARMMLPGIQALFGFQLVAVFNQRFELLTKAEQNLHLLALVLVTCSVVLVMAPAAYHRQAGHRASRHFLELANRFLTASMLPLMLASCADLYLIARIVTGSRGISFALATSGLLAYFTVWFVFPRLGRLSRAR